MAGNTAVTGSVTSLLAGRCGRGLDHAHVPTPRHLIASKGTDAATAIYQPSTGRYWDFWRAKKNKNGYARYVVLNEIPLNRLQALPLGYGEPASPAP